MMRKVGPMIAAAALGVAGLLGCGGDDATTPSAPASVTATLSVYNVGGVRAGSFSVTGTASEALVLNETYLAAKGVDTSVLDLRHCALRGEPTRWPIGALLARSSNGVTEFPLQAGPLELWCGERRYAGQNQNVVDQGMGVGLLGREVEYRMIRPGEPVLGDMGELIGTGKDCSDDVVWPVGADIVSGAIDIFNEASNVEGRPLVVVRLVDRSPRVIGCADLPGAEGYHTSSAVVTEGSEWTLLRELDEVITGTQNVTTNAGPFERIKGYPGLPRYSPMGASTLRLAEVLADPAS